MASVTVARRIDAPVDSVFGAVSDPRRFAEAIGGVSAVEFLSPATSGTGTRFRQTRTNGGKTMTMDFEVTEWIPNERIRIVNEIHGTTWDSVFTFAPDRGATALTMRMGTRSRPWLARVLVPVMMPLFINKAVAKDIDALKAYCERR